MVQSLALEDTLPLIEKQLQRQPHLTLTEAAALTGLSIEAARDALDVLLTQYVCRLQVSEYGDLIYNFGDPLRRRGAKTWAERVTELEAQLWQVFTVLYKVWIAVTLVVYFVLFLVLLILVVIASSSRRSATGRHRSASSAALDLRPLVHMLAAIFRWRTITGTIDYTRDQHGYRYRHYQPEPGILNSQKKNFVAAVYDFVFGPPRVSLDPLQQEKEVAAYVRRNRGIILASELSALAGWTFPQAETFLTDCVIRYQGETKVSDQAVLYGQFDTLIRGVGTVDEGEIVYYWDEYEPEYELTGNSSPHNVLIIALNSVNLLFSLLVLTGSVNELLHMALDQQFATTTAGLASGSVVPLVLGWLPLVFSLLFFLIPAGRLVRIQALRRQRHDQNIRKRLFKAIFAQHGQPQTVREIMATVNANAQEEPLALQSIEARMKELALDMPGDLVISETAEVQFTFPRITQEVQAGRQLRRQRRVDESLGAIIVEADNQ
jgi:hypothetical protein